MTSPATRVSVNQVLRCFRNGLRLAADPFFACRTGLRFHVSSYGMYGFALLGSANFRQTMRFAEKYHELATPLVDLSFKEEGDAAAWTVVPLPHREVDAQLYRFLVALQFGIEASLHRDSMGSSFAPRVLLVTWDPSGGAGAYFEFLRCPVVLARIGAVEPHAGQVVDNAFKRK